MFKITSQLSSYTGSIYNLFIKKIWSQSNKRNY